EEFWFRTRVASLIRHEHFKWIEEPERTHLFYDAQSDSSLVLQSIATPNSFFGVFAALHKERLLPDQDRSKLNRIAASLQNLAQGLEGIAARRWFFHNRTSETSGHSPDASVSSSPGIADRNQIPEIWGAYSKHPFYDFLTDLPSRSLVEDRLNMALAHARYSREKVAVLILDIDNFKRINDFLGNSAGDALLRNIARRIRQSLREEDTLGRMGGDEFVLLLPDIHLIQDIEFRVQKILDGIREPFQIEGKEIFGNCSIGIAVYPDDHESQEKLIKSAKAAMIHAKGMGKGRCQFYKPFMEPESVHQISIEGALRRALERDEFQLYFQPKLTIQTGRIQGMEALLRWNHPERGVLNPSEFMAVAEESGLIEPIGEWVLLNACRQLRAWKRSGLPPISVAVNLSGYQVNQPHWISTVQGIFEVTGVRPDQLEMEITETVLMDNSEVALSNLRHLNEMGVRISIDDFGTGYSSLSYLKRFPIHALKIDRSFVRGIRKRKEGATDAVITKAIVSLAQALNLRSVAEGVEHCQEREYLQSIGCDDMQGFLFSEPLPVEKINYMFNRNLKNPVRFHWPPEGKPYQA
ncbi:MAG: EAL domain-containing protein, partial [Nitrospinaceae bacterium]|nr:EAL domain-containing protein [Nitrospinaceae bacterium]NIR57685.1 EAL domain-containing protein [Nitrospinaceae bacterium]NIT85027.1 EAL domain-containing protein [Nitrospinaceae bacterium]NIW08749.1 EAL domain-containing protein [Nitrospinaceae bacterium]NIX37340.1 EAL domain-containing protein [Nitrospinaceae bacterium]